MENNLESTVATRRQQVQQLLEEQQQLCVKWEALEQVLQEKGSNGPAAAAAAAAAVAVAARRAWDGFGGGLAQQVMLADGVPLVRYPYSIGMYVITPDAVKSVCWPLNMRTWQVDTGNNQAHAERAGRALWAALRPERWRLLRATWLTMGSQLNRVQEDFAHLHSLLQNIGQSKGKKSSSGSSSRLQQHQSPTSSSAQSSLATAAAAAAAPAGDDGCATDAQQQQQQQQAHGPALDGFASMEDSTAYDYAAAAVQVEAVLLREDAISYQLCGAFLDLLDPIEFAVGYVSSWPYHPQALAMFDVIFKLGEPPEALDALHMAELTGGAAAMEL
ncbi:hypothetical protein OEZ85_002096 [Tetradesmus obliquus]|uniref:Uncharacterized protein n=1 Tax=Tetradesmus obliquus TaxID=3088 RepID=A0ABY8U227_TETOB|nr:hypothetical protein OEZ85_002096 [Tetradesmus obliquus]